MLHTWLMGMTHRFGRFSYLWFLEFQARGAPHVHVALSISEPGAPDRQAHAMLWVDICARELHTTDAERLAQWRFNTHERAWEAAYSPKGIAKYCLKYSLKPTQKIVPEDFRDVGRFWGTSRDFRQAPALVLIVDEAGARDIISDHPASQYEILPNLITMLEV